MSMGVGGACDAKGTAPAPSASPAAALAAPAAGDAMGAEEPVAAAEEEAEPEEEEEEVQVAQARKKHRPTSAPSKAASATAAAKLKAAAERCTRCYQGHARCSGVAPCERCVGMGVGDACDAKGKAEGGPPSPGEATQSLWQAGSPDGDEA